MSADVDRHKARLQRRGEIALDRVRYATDETVWVLRDVRGDVVAIMRDGQRCRDTALALTREPLSDGEPDPSAPYTAEEWMVQS